MLGDLIVRVGANISGFTTAMRDVSKEVGKVVSDVNRSFSGFDKLGSTLKNVGTQMSASVTLPLVAAGGAALKFASDFDLGMRQVSSLLGGVTQNEFEDLSKKVLELSRRLGVDAVGATIALREAIGAGVPKENAIEFLEVASKAAIGGVTSTTVAVDGLTTIINSFGLTTKEAKGIADAMFQAVNVGKFTFEELAASLSIASGISAQLSVGFDELLAGAATLTSQGYSVSEAMSAMRSAMVAIVNPNTDMNALIAATGYESGVALLKAEGLEGALELLRQKAGVSGAALTQASAGGKSLAEALDTVKSSGDSNLETLSRAMGRVEGLGATLGLTGDKAAIAASHLDEVRKASDGAGASQVAFEEINKSLSQQFNTLVNNLKATAIELGQSFIPAVSGLLKNSAPLVEMLASSVKWFTELPVGVQAAVVGVLGFTAAIGPLTYGLGAIVSAATGTGQALLTLMTLAGNMSGAFGGLTTALSNVGYAVSQGLTGALSAGEVALLRFGTVAALAGAAFLGWKLGEWTADSQEATLKAERFATGVAVLKGNIKALDDQLAEGKISYEQWHQAVENAGRRARQSHEGVKVAVDAEAAAAKELEAKQIAMASSFTKTTEELKKNITSHSSVTSAIKTHTDAVVEHEKKQAKLFTATDKIKDAIKREESALYDVIRRYKDGKATFEEFIQANTRLETLKQQSTYTFKDQEIAVDGLRDEMEDLSREISASLSPSMVDLTSNVKGLTLPVYDAAAAMKQLGITSSAELKAAAEAAKSAHDTIAADTGSTSGEIQAAWKKATEAQIAYARSIGDTATADALEAQLNAHKDHGTSLKNTWSTTMTQVSTAFTDFSKDIVDGLINGDLSIGGALEKLGASFSRVFVENAMSYVNTFIEKGIDALMTKLGDLLGMIPGIGSALGGIFGTSGASTAAGQVTGTAAGGAATSSGVAGAASGLAGTLTAVFSGISAVTDVLSLFGVGEAGQKDRLNRISDATGYLAWAYDTGRVKDNIWDIRNQTLNLDNAFNGWYHGFLASMGELTEDILAAVRGIALDTGDIRVASQAVIPELTALRMAQEVSGPRAVTVHIDNFIGTQEFADKVAGILNAQLALQG